MAHGVATNLVLAKRPAVQREGRRRNAMANFQQEDGPDFGQKGGSWRDPSTPISLFDLAENLMGVIESTHPVTGFQGHMSLRESLGLSEGQYLDLINGYARYFDVDL